MAYAAAMKEFVSVRTFLASAAETMPAAARMIPFASVGAARTFLASAAEMMPAAARMIPFASVGAARTFLASAASAA